MSPLARIDAAVLAWHQDLVDALQRQPLWFARLCWAGLACAEFARVVVVPRQAWQLVLLAVFLVVLLDACRSSARFVYVGALPAGFRLVFVVLLLLDVLVGLLAPSPLRLPGLLSSVLVTSFYYFGACRPPKPRLPRGRLSLGAA